MAGDTPVNLRSPCFARAVCIKRTSAPSPLLSMNSTRSSCITISIYLARVSPKYACKACTSFPATMRPQHCTTSTSPNGRLSIRNAITPPCLLELRRNFFHQRHHLQHVSNAQHAGHLAVEWEHTGFVNIACDPVQITQRLQLLDIVDAKVGVPELRLG